MFSMLDLTKPPIIWEGEAVDSEQAELLAIAASPNGYRVKKVEEHV